MKTTADQLESRYKQLTAESADTVPIFCFGFLKHKPEVSAMEVLQYAIENAEEQDAKDFPDDKDVLCVTCGREFQGHEGEQCYGCNHKENLAMEER